MSKFVRIGADMSPIDWRSIEGVVNEEDSDDEVMEYTPADVVTVLGFDPLELDDDEPTDNNCGIGPDGFEPGNTCAQGGGGGSEGGMVVDGDDLSSSVKAGKISPSKVVKKLDDIVDKLDNGSITPIQAKTFIEKIEGLAGANTETHSGIRHALEAAKSVAAENSSTSYEDIPYESPTPTSTPDPVFPGSLSSMMEVKTLGGSTGAKLYKDDDGNEFVVKKGNSAAHIKEEYAADKLYQAMGIKVPESTMLDENGVPTKVAKFVEGKQLGQLKGTERAAAIESIKNNFAADALLANWDVAGSGMDNILVDADGNAIRIDNGGSMRFRAKGGAKEFGGAVKELESMRTSANAGKVFGSLTDEQVAGQIYALDTKRESILNAAPEDLRPTLEARLDYMKTWADNKLSPEGKPPEAIQKMLDDLTHGYYKSDTSVKLSQEVALKINKLYDAKNAAIGEAANAGAPKTSKPADNAPHGITDANKIVSHLKGSNGDYSPLYLKKIKFLNELGVADGTLYVPPGTTQAQLDHLASVMPSGTLISKVASMKGAGWKKGGVGVFTAKSAAIISSMPDGKGVIDAKYNTVKTGGKTGVATAPSTGWGKLVKIENGHATLEPAKALSSKKMSEWKNQKLTYAERQAVLDWTNGEYGQIRKAIGKGEIGSKHGAIGIKTEQFLAGVEKAPKYEGVVFRGIKDYGTASAAYVQSLLQTGVGGTWVDKSPHSLSRSPKTAYHFSAGKVLMAVKTKTARSIENLTYHSSEKELIGMPNTKYRVVSMTKNVKTTHGSVNVLVELEEVD